MPGQVTYGLLLAFNDCAPYIQKCILCFFARYATILAFDVKIERDAQDMADSLGVKIFQADIIYHLFDQFTAFREELKRKKREEFKNVAVFPCKLKVCAASGPVLPRRAGSGSPSRMLTVSNRLHLHRHRFYLNSFSIRATRLSWAL